MKLKLGIGIILASLALVAATETSAIFFVFGRRAGTNFGAQAWASLP